MNDSTPTLMLAKTERRIGADGTVTYINPDGLHREPLPTAPEPDPRQDPCGTCADARDLNGDAVCTECGQRFSPLVQRWLAGDR